VLDIWLAGVVVSLISIVSLFGVWAAVTVFTIAGDRRRTRRLHPELDSLRPWYSGSQLAELEDALARVLAEERGTLPSSPRS